MRRIVGSAIVFFGMAWLCLVPISAAQADILITIDKSEQKMVVDVDGSTRWIWPVSTGRRGYDTPSGRFKPFRLEEDHYSKEWDEAPMPYSIFFTTEGHAIHGSYETRNLGRRASHGCVRLAPKNAAKLFELVKRQGLSSARVVVTGGFDAPLVSQRPAPTDPSRQARKTIPAGAAQAPNYIPQEAYGYAPARGQFELREPALPPSYRGLY